MHCRFLPLLCSFLSCGIAMASGQVDDFDDGNADGWTISDVLAGVGGTPSEITFPDGNQVRLKSSASPNPEALGASRVGLFREDVTYQDVTVLMDMVTWDGGLAQDFGLLARIKTVGLGTTSGYAVTLDVDEQAIYLSRLDNEVAATLGKIELVMEVGTVYRFRLTAIGNTISAGVAEAASPGEELVVLEFEDDTYSEGTNGFFTNAGVADGTTDATFDRFVAFDPSGDAAPPRITSFSHNDSMVMIDYAVPIQAGGAFVLEVSSDLQEWSVLETGNVFLGFTEGSFAAADEASSALRFYRVNEAPPLFREDFEKGAEGWETSVSAGDTQWELGTPAAPDLTEARSGTQAYGTFLDRPYTDGAATSLRSPIIDLAGKRRPAISFYYHVDVTEGQEGVQVNYLSESGETLASVDEIFWTATDGWTLFESSLPDETLDQKIIVEWIFRSDTESPNGSGFFLDDVVID